MHIRVYDSAWCLAGFRDHPEDYCYFLVYCLASFQYASSDMMGTISALQFYIPSVYQSSRQ